MVMLQTLDLRLVGGGSFFSPAGLRLGGNRLNGARDEISNPDAGAGGRVVHFL